MKSLIREMSLFEIELQTGLLTLGFFFCFLLLLLLWGVLFVCLFFTKSLSFKVFVDKGLLRCHLLKLSLFGFFSHIPVEV